MVLNTIYPHFPKVKEAALNYLKQVIQCLYKVSVIVYQTKPDRETPTFRPFQLEIIVMTPWLTTRWVLCKNTKERRNHCGPSTLNNDSHTWEIPMPHLVGLKWPSFQIDQELWFFAFLPLVSLLGLLISFFCSSAKVLLNPSLTKAPSLFQMISLLNYHIKLLQSYTAFSLF